MPPRRFVGKIKPPARLDASARLMFSGGQTSSGGLNFEEDFAKLQAAFAAIYKHRASSLSFETLYRAAYRLVMHKHAERLYNGVKDEIAKWLENEIVGTRVAQALQKGSEAFLSALVDGYKDHRLCLKLITSILMYLDKVYCQSDGLSTRRHDVPPTTAQMGLFLFRDLVIKRGQIPNNVASPYVNGKGKAREDRSHNLPIFPSLISSFLMQLRHERAGGIIDRSILKGVCTMLNELISTSFTTTEPANSYMDGLHTASESHAGLTVYFADLEGAVLEDTTSYYAEEGARMVTEMSVVEYIAHVNRRIEEEYARTVNYLVSSTARPLVKVVEHELVWKHRDFLLSGIEAMITQAKYHELALAYKQLGAVEGGHLGLNLEIKKYIIASGTAIKTNRQIEGKGTDSANNNTAIAIQWVEDVLELKDRMDKLFVLGCKNDKSFQSSFNGGFEVFINAYTKAPESISLFIDDKLKKGLKDMPEDQVEEVMDKAVGIFRFLLDKDIFERYYKIHLARRLLHAKVMSDDIEKSVLAKFKVEVGYQFTTKMEGMFNDMRISQEIMSGFQKFVNELQLPPAFTLSATVLTSTFWPSTFANTLSNEAGLAQHCHWPAEIEHGIQTFQRYYNTRHSGRKLTWQAVQGSADVKGIFDSRPIELNLSTYGMVILLQFNLVDGDRALTMEELKVMTNIPEGDLIRNLQSLSLAKYKILRKQPMTRDVKPTDLFSVNTAFTAPLARVKIPTIATSSSTSSSRSVVENESESQETRQKIEEGRKHMIEASIVRIMKDRKTLEHNLLVAEVTKHMSGRFIPNPMMIKKRIESLLEREYLERAEADSKRYNYLA